MSDHGRHGWRTTSRRDRLVALAAVAAVHLGILLVLLTVGPARLQRLAERPLQLITLPPPPSPRSPSPAKPAPKPAAAAPKPAASAKPRAIPIKTVPAPAPVAVAAAADVSLGASIGSVSLDAIGNGIGIGSGDGGTGGGGVSRHAEWIGGAITNSDYPEEAKRVGLQGVVDVRVIVMTNGRARNCSVDHSSGSVELDRMTCALVEQRLLFSPALDAAGKPVEEVAGRRFRYVATQRRR